MAEEVRRNCTATCKNCRYWCADCKHEPDGTTMGECRYGPPAMNEHGDGVFPKMFTSEWCGRFEARPRKL
jgi:hypothetical protein